VRRMNLLPSRTATLLLPLPRPHQVWQPTSFLALHTLPATPHGHSLLFRTSLLINVFASQFLSLKRKMKLGQNLSSVIQEVPVWNILFSFITTIFVWELYKFSLCMCVIYSRSFIITLVHNIPKEYH
jgi:hypothetical protein